MKRFLFWGLVAAALFILFFLGLNLFDSAPARGTPASPAVPGGMAPAGNLDPGNGFFIAWGFAEPPEADPMSPGFRRQVQELFQARPRGYLSRSPYGQWLARLNSGYVRHWQGANMYFPQLQQEDAGAYFAARRAQVAERLGRFAPLLQRYQQILQAPELEDFTPLNWDCPARSLLLATHAAKLFAAAQVLSALDGRWAEAGDGLLDALAAGMKLIGSGRTIKVNALGRAMVELSLRSLAALLNHPDCPADFVRLIAASLPPEASARFGTGAVRAFHWQSFRWALRRVKEERIVDPFLLKDYFRSPAAFYALERFVAISGPRVFTTVHALAAFFVKENETAALLRDAWESVGRLEETPPWKWRDGTRMPERKIPGLGTPFWWLRNPLGKMMVRSAIPFTWPILRHYVYRSHELQARYDLVRLLARARLAAAGTRLDEAALRGLLAAAGERDPFSGSPYRFSREHDAIYAIGADRSDDNGREQADVWRDSDIAVPVKFVISDSVN
jgi:hypothetical protein